MAAVKGCRFDLALGGPEASTPPAISAESSPNSSDESLSTRTFPNPREFLLRHVYGYGIEIGPLHAPFPKPPPPTTIRYVDKYDLKELQRRNPDIPANQIVPPDIIGDSHELPIPSGSLDFILASHVLEHLDNPIAALLEWHRVLVPGGRVLCVLPESRVTFDAGRPLTGLHHLLWDFVNAGSLVKYLSDLSHAAEYNLNRFDDLDVEEAIRRAASTLQESYDTHFHVWTFDTFREHIHTASVKYGLPFEIEEMVLGETEFSAVMRSRDDSHFEVPASVPRASR